MKLSAGVGVLAVVLFLSGCCLFMKPPPPPPANACVVDLKPSRNVTFKHVWVHQVDDRLVVEGELHPRSFIDKDAGHIDVRVIDANGHLLKAFKVAPADPVFDKQNGRVARFTASVGLVVAPDAKVYLEARPGSVNDSN